MERNGEMSNQVREQRHRPELLPRWILIAFVAAMLILSGIGYWFYTSQKRLVLKNAKETLSVVARLQIKQIVQWRS
ncbi:MAG TPA: hypothetical protein PLQ76_01775, partial [bacterium]|nr:hypothetical protein [bacterium]